MLLAYACSPYRGSEPETGWRRALALSKHFDTWVICVSYREFRENIERYLSEHGEIPSLQFCFVPGLSFDVPILNGYAAVNGPVRRWGLTATVNF